MVLRSRAWALPLIGLLAGATARADPDLTVDDAIRIARGHHPSIEAQRGQADAADGRRQQALAHLLPYVTGNVAFQPTTANLAATPAQVRALLGTAGSDTVLDASGMPVSVSCRTPGIGNCAVLRPIPQSWALHNYWEAQLGVAWTVWDWGRSIYGYRSARDLAQAQAVGVRAASNDVVLQTRLAFFGALAADEQAAVAVDAVRTYDAHLAQTRGLHDSGLRTGIDVATAESAAASAEIAALAGEDRAARRRTRSCWSRLARIAGAPGAWSQPMRRWRPSPVTTSGVARRSTISPTARSDSGRRWRCSGSSSRRSRRRSRRRAAATCPS